jgi:pimeloyl-ACP methyl ester carboxylesterase
MAPAHKFVTARDGTSIAYRVAGEGEPALVFTNGYATSDFYWRHMARHFQQFSTVVTWDLKGHGRSSAARDLEAVTIEDSVDDLRRVMDAAGAETAVLVGFSLGCQIVFEAWRHIPERIEAMVPILGTYGRPFDNLIHPTIGNSLFKAFRTLGPRSAPILIGGAYLGMRTPMAHFLNQAFGMVGRHVGRATMQPFYDHFALIHPKTWVAMGIAAQRHSAADLLEDIDVPVLVIAGGRDAFTPLSLSYDMRDRIPSADLIVLEDATHSGLFEYPEEITHAVDSFLRTHHLAGRTRRAG